MASRIMFVILSVFMLTVTSCTSTKNFTYFNNTKDSTFESMISNVEPIIQPSDIFTISVTSLNKEASEDFNNNKTGDNGGYLVNTDGHIQMPTLGKIKAAGFTKTQLTEEITNIILSRKLLLEPIVTIRYTNFQVTLIGEVNNPTVITVPNEKISLLNAIAQAGDLTIYGKRDNILLIREKDGKRNTHHININTEDFFTSPYYYLQPNDVVYVEPNKAKIATSGRSQQILPIALTAVSFLLVIFNNFFK